MFLNSVLNFSIKEEIVQILPDLVIWTLSCLTCPTPFLSQIMFCFQMLHQQRSIEKMVLAVESHQSQQDLHGASCGLAVIARAAWPRVTRGLWTERPDLNSKQMLSWYATSERSSAPSECRCSGNLAEVVIPWRWYLPMAGSGKWPGHKSSDTSSSSEYCNVLKLICQMWWTTEGWNNLSSLFP